MFICQVDVGQEAPVQIVTGAQNVHEGDLVPAALHNSWLPGGVHITKGKLRGEVSNGMLCSFGELGLTQNDLPGVFASMFRLPYFYSNRFFTCTFKTAIPYQGF